MRGFRDFRRVCFLCLLLDMAVYVMGIPSQLKVAACLPVGSPPYVQQQIIEGVEKGYLHTGFEVELWTQVYLELASITAHKNSSELVQLVGTEPPELISMKLEDIVLALKNSSIDIGFCGLYQKPDLENSFDFAPVHALSGLQAIVKYSRQPTIAALFRSMITSMSDVYAQASLLILIYFALVFAHVVWAIEREANGPFDNHYGPGIVDSLWFAIVTAFTVGYGDKCVSSTWGKLVTIVWMTFGIYFCGMFTAALTSAFVQKKLSVTTSDIAISSIEDLIDLSFSSAVAVSASLRIRERQGVLSGVKTVPFASDIEVARQLLREADEETPIVGVVDARAAHYFTRIDPEFRGRLVPLGPILADEEVALGVGRKGEGQHPILGPLSLAVLKHMRGRSRRVYQSEVARWFGTPADDDEIAEQPATADYDAKLREGNRIAAIVLLVAIVFWAISVAMHYRNEIREEMIRQRFLKALAVGKKYGLNELREGASKMFKRTDKDKSGALDVAEITSLLGKLGKDISISDINRYMHIEDEYTQQEGADQDEGVSRTGSGGAGTGRGALLIREPQFVKIIEGIVLDETVEQEEDEDLNVPPQRRHLIKVAADVQTQVRDLDRYVTEQVASVSAELAILSSKLETLITAVAPDASRRDAKTDLAHQQEHEHEDGQTRTLSRAREQLPVTGVAVDAAEGLLLQDVDPDSPLGAAHPPHPPQLPGQVAEYPRLRP